MSCCKKPLDTSNGNKLKTSIILKRGRTILKRCQDPKKHAFRNSFFKTTTTANNRDLHKVNISVLFPSKNRDLPANDVASDKPALKEAIKLEDKLISGEEIEFCPAEYVPKKADICLVSQNSKRQKIRKDESAKSHSKSNKSIHIPIDTSPIIMEDYPKLYVTVTNTSDKSAMTKSSLLKNIRGIQSADPYGDSYGINISNSRFFVPKNYIFSGVECSMDDLKFEVDPEMSKQLQRSYSNSQVNTDSFTSINVESDCSPTDNNTTAMKTETSIIDRITSNDAAIEHKDLDSKCLKVLPTDTSLEESDKSERKQRRFLKKRESKPSCEIVDSLLDETTKDHEHVVTPKVSHNLQTEAVEQKAAQDKLWTAKHVIIDDCKVEIESDVPVTESSKVYDAFEDAGKSNLPNENIEIDVDSSRSTKSTDVKSEEIKSSCEPLNAFSPFLSTPEIFKSTRLPFTSVTPCTEGINVHSEKDTKILEPLNYSSLNREKQDEFSICDKESQGSKYSNLSETNRANRIRFLRDSLQDDARENDNPPDSSYVEEATPSESTEFYTNEGSKASRDIVDSSGSICKDQDLPVGRTSSLKERFETIMENVELRTTPGRRLQTGISCDRKSLALS